MRTRTRYYQRPRANPWMAVGWICLGALLLLGLLVFMSFCGLALLAGAA